MAQLTWKKISAEVASQYSVSRQAHYATMQNVRLHGDDMSLTVTLDIIVEPGILLVSLYNYDGGLWEDFQLTYTIPAETVTLGKKIAENVLLDSMSLRYLHGQGFTQA